MLIKSNTVRTDLKIAGQVQGLWVLTGLVCRSVAGVLYAQGNCQCGSRKWVSMSNILLQKTNSCGCQREHISRKKATTHGLSNHPLYAVWNAMIQRCQNVNNPGYANYGGRGIQVCGRWDMPAEHGFINWLVDMGERPPGMSIHRHPNDADYCPETCSWATREVQDNERTDSQNLTHNGVTRTIQQWSRKCKLSRGAITGRLERGWSAEKALSTPSTVGNSQFDEAMEYIAEQTLAGASARQIHAVIAIGSVSGLQKYIQKNNHSWKAVNN